MGRILSTIASVSSNNPTDMSFRAALVVHSIRRLANEWQGKSELMGRSKKVARDDKAACGGYVTWVEAVLSTVIRYTDRDHLMLTRGVSLFVRHPPEDSL